VAADAAAAPAGPTWSGSRLREMLGVGLPAAGMLLFEATAFSVSGLMVGWLGAVPLAAHQIAITCASLTFMVPLGLSKMGLDPALASGTFVTTLTDVMGFFAFLGLATVMLM
jgi:MATE family multidrug resistance protein